MVARSRVLLAVPLLVLAACSGDSNVDSPRGSVADACVDEGEPVEGEAKLYIEHNATDQDTGVHGLLGTEGLSQVCLRMPDGKRMILLEPVEQFGDLGIADFFFEGREPPADEYSIDDLKTDFPEGGYTYSGIDPAGTAFVGTAQFTHDIPAAPVITEPELAEEENPGDVTLPATGLVVRWEPTTETLDGAALSVTGYEVIVTDVEHEDPNGLSQPVYDVHVPADRTELAVVDGFLEPATVYELELLVLEESGNQTMALGFFTTET
jgi:hypothetical protein